MGVELAAAFDDRQERADTTVASEGVLARTESHGHFIEPIRYLWRRGSKMTMPPRTFHGGSDLGKRMEVPIAHPGQQESTLRVIPRDPQSASDLGA